MLKKLIKLDWILLICVFLLLGIGLISLYSISLFSVESGEKYGIFSRQIIYSVAGIAVMFFFASSNYHYLRTYGTFFYFATLVILILVLIWGLTVRGTSGWLGIGFLRLQPVEIAKLTLIIFLASFISQKKMEIGEGGRIIISLVLSSIMIGLVLCQPDFGSAMVLAGIWAGMMIVSGLSRKFFFALVAVIVLSSMVFWFFLAPYQKDRFLNLVHPEQDPQGSGYNVIQSMVAVGSGGIFGKGIGYGTQSQLNFLPEKHNDFIFASIMEELGLVGGMLLIFLFLLTLYRIRRIAAKAPDNFGFLLASGILIMFFLQIAVNIGMNIGLVPVAGLSLPLLSYGGSFLIIVFACLGIILNIHSSQASLANFTSSDYND